MEDSKIESISYLSVTPSDINNEFVDVWVKLEDDDFTYCLEFTTFNSLQSKMGTKKLNFIQPDYPCIIVRELTIEVIKETLEAYLKEEKNRFWLKLYHVIPFLTINDLQFLIDRNLKESEY